jgi:preprotein translocase subunit YajC
MPELFGLLLLQEAGPSGAGSIIGSVLPIVLVFLVFYFLIIRPQKQERQRVEQETQEMLASLKAGDKIVTTGGILGTVVAVRDDTVQLRVAEGVKIEVLKSSVGRKTTEQSRAVEAK